MCARIQMVAQRKIGGSVLDELWSTVWSGTLLSLEAYRHRSSVVELSIRNRAVVGSSPTGGSGLQQDVKMRDVEKNDVDRDV
jgi:hypothetical protein